LFFLRSVTHLHVLKYVLCLAVNLERLSLNSTQANDIDEDVVRTMLEWSPAKRKDDCNGRNTSAGSRCL
jgi:hypothetical protein